MNFEQTINEELRAATKSGDKIRLETLRSLRAAIIEFNKSGVGREMNDSDKAKILNTAVKKRKDAIEMYEKGGRMDLAEKEKTELSVIMEFLPKQMSNDEIKQIISEIISETGAKDSKDLGKIMGAAMKKLAGQADGNLVQLIAKELLS